MAEASALLVRDLTLADLPEVQRILRTSDYIHYRVDPDELRDALERLPAVGVVSRAPGPLGHMGTGMLQAFLLLSGVVPPAAWVGAFGVTWSQSGAMERHLDVMLAWMLPRAAALGGETLYYSASDYATDWLRAPLEARGFRLVEWLRSYDKLDFTVPDRGNGAVVVRPFSAGDVPGVLEVERLAFAPQWRYDAAGFLSVARRYPYFVVAEDARGIAGYQFNTIDLATGYLVRIAVHPRAEGQGIGTRLLAEAVRYFERQGVVSIALNTEETNTRAHALYERFGFQAVPPRSFVLGRALPGAER